MADSTTMNRIYDLLGKRYNTLGEKASERIQTWLSGRIPYAYPEIIASHLTGQQIDLLFDSFCQVLPFGTGGRRGRVGYGPNRVNLTTVSMTVQGHCDYLHATFPERQAMAVVIANDMRAFHDVYKTYLFLGDSHPLLGVTSRFLAKLACQIYVANGITCYFPSPQDNSGILTTPELSYLINRLDAVGGVNISASHNPPDDNGIKVYDQCGSQPIPPVDQILMDVMEHAVDISFVGFDAAVKEKMVRDIPEELHRDYIRGYARLHHDLQYSSTSNIPVVYTPLCGCGLTTVGDLFKEVNIPFLVPPAQALDPKFSAIPFKVPNPEVFQVTEPARQFADLEGIGIVLSSDPDADRIGLEVKLDDGSWYHFDGNQIAVVLCYFLMLDPQGPRRTGLVIETLVTTKMLREIVRRAKGALLIDDLLVGFKYVANVLNTLDRTGLYNDVRCSSDQLVLAAEESHGIMILPTVRDKDAAPASMYLATLYQRLRREDKTILDYYLHILQNLGNYVDVHRSIMMVGAEGMLRKNRIMAFLRENAPQQFAGFLVREVIDYWDEDKFGPFVSESDRLPRNIIQVVTDSLIVTIRPSGTEPKLKLYCQLLSVKENCSSVKGFDLLKAIQKKCAVIARKVYTELLQSIGINIGYAGLLLPDIIDLDRKINFEKVTVEQLRDFLSKEEFTNLADLHVWLVGAAAELTPGANPLPAVKESISYLCDEWAGQFGHIPVFNELNCWAKET